MNNLPTKPGFYWLLGTDNVACVVQVKNRISFRHPNGMLEFYFPGYSISQFIDSAEMHGKQWGGEVRNTAADIVFLQTELKRNADKDSNYDDGYNEGIIFAIERLKGEE